VDTEGILGAVTPSPPQEVGFIGVVLRFYDGNLFMPNNNFTSGLISGANALCPWASGCYDVFGRSWFSERGKRRAEFKMNSSSELT